MKRTLLVILTSLCLVFAGCVSIATAQEANNDNPQKGDFNFIFKYGVTARNTLDTAHGTFTKDMVSDPSITIDLPLTADDMDAIYLEMVEIDFFHYPDKFSVDVAENETKIEVAPYSTYFFRVDYNGKTKELLWHDKYLNSDAKADKLKELINLIKGIIESKPEYQTLPQPSGGYL